jgi:hypothetical protein
MHACGFVEWPYISYRTMNETLPQEFSKYVKFHHSWPLMAIHLTMISVIITQKCGSEVSLKKIMQEQVHIWISSNKVEIFHCNSERNAPYFLSKV